MMRRDPTISKASLSYSYSIIIIIIITGAVPLFPPFHSNQIIFYQTTLSYSCIYNLFFFISIILSPLFFLLINPYSLK